MAEKTLRDLDELTMKLTWDAEENLLGSLLIAGTDGTRDAIEAVSAIIVTEDFLPFYRENLHRRIYDAMLRGKTDQLSVAQTLHFQGQLRDGDIPFMSHVIAGAIGLDCEHYAREVKQLAEERRGHNHNGYKPKFKGGI